MEKTLNSKLLDFQKKVGIIKKDAKNPHFKNTYATLTQILSEVKPLLTECCLILLQPINENGVGTIIIDSVSGEKIESFITLPTNLSPQQLGSAITYYRRYTLASLLSLEIDDDDAQSTNNTPKTETKPQLTASQFEAMINTINDGNAETVKKALDKYIISEQYMKAINLAIEKNKK